MKLVTFGDSWVWGDEITPATNEYRNSVNIGGLVYKDYQFTDYINYANNGASNDRILLQILEYKKSKYYSAEDFIMVGLSSPIRNVKYLNGYNTVLTLPANDINQLPEEYVDNSDFLRYFKDDVKWGINNRNDLVRYCQNIFAIKSLLSSNKKYIVWQSIDDIHELYKNIEFNFHEIHLHHDFNNTTITHDSTIFFEKDVIENLLYQDLEKTQVWINFKEKSWFKFLEEKFHESNGKFKPMIGYGLHPNEIGIKFWYDNILNTYIKNIL